MKKDRYYHMSNKEGSLGYMRGTDRRDALRKTPKYLKKSGGFKLAKRAGYVLKAGANIYKHRGFIKKRR